MTLGVAVGGGIVMGLFMVMASEPDVTLRMTKELFAQALLIGLGANLPMSVPLGIVASFYARSVLRRTQGRSRAWWIWRGAVSGLVIGGLGGAAYGFLMGGARLSEGVLLYLVIGGVAGPMCGAIVGLWCSTQPGQGNRAAA
jgi:hypothetical protein